MAPNAAPGIFLGWRIDFGMRYRGALKIIDYDMVRAVGFNPQRFKTIPQNEVYFPEVAVFPFLEARKTSLKQLKDVRPQIQAVDVEPPKIRLPWADEAEDGKSKNLPALIDPVAEHDVPCPPLGEVPLPRFRIQEITSKLC